MSFHLAVEWTLEGQVEVARMAVEARTAAVE
jgi:hypothetical protein